MIVPVVGEGWHQIGKKIKETQMRPDQANNRQVTPNYEKLRKKNL